MIKLLSVIALGLILVGCVGTTDKIDPTNPEPPKVQTSPLASELSTIPLLNGPPITVAVYSFTDKTGQRKPGDNVANLSSAVTQGAEVWVINALQEAGNGKWFIPLERIGLENLVKERQLIRTTRDQYNEADKPLDPMKFAGVMLEGGIIGYDSNTAVGGAGARYLGIGKSSEYRIDTVTVAMRLVSVSSGEVMLSVATDKTIASTRDGTTLFTFLDMGTQSVEIETGSSANEPVNYAVRAAIEAAVVEMIYEGKRKGLWNFK